MNAPAAGAARADLCRLLAACYYEPAADFAEEGVFDRMVEAASGISPALGDQARAVRDAFADEPTETLLVDYARLFLGPPQPLAKPYASVWLEPDGRTMGPSTAAILALYAEGGFAVSDEFRELPDHVAAELEFLYLLTFTALRARVDHDDALRVRVEALRGRVLDAHLGAWLPRFCAAVVENAETRFYRALAGLTGAFVAHERASPLS